jgi:microcystin-dependent protein
MAPFIGQIQAVGFNFAPRGSANSNRQVSPISQNTALLANTYGGNGYRLSNVRWGEKAVQETIALTEANRIGSS